MNTFLTSAKRNPNLEVIIFSNIVFQSEFPENVKQIPFSFEELKGLVNEKIESKVNLKDPYKLCDLKPMYGHVFSEYIKDYSFWAFGDLDLIFGDLDLVLKKLENEEYDLISLRRSWISGCLCFIKNSRKTNLLYKQSKDLEFILSNERYLGFDEISLRWDVIRSLPLNEIEFPYDNFTKIAFSSNTLKIFSEDLIKEAVGKNEYLVWENKKIFNNKGVEYVLYHFITEKRKFYFQYLKLNQIPQKLFVNRFGFFTSHQFGKTRIITSINRRINALPSFILFLLKRIRNKIFN